MGNKKKKRQNFQDLFKKHYFENIRNCKHKEKERETWYVFRPNYPHGRKAKPVYRRVRIWGWKCKDCGLKVKYSRNGA